MIRLKSLSGTESDFFLFFQKNHPSPSPTLHAPNPYTFLVSVVLSAQCTDERVNRVMPSLILHADCPEAMVALGVEKIQTFISSLGLFKRKALSLVKLSEEIILRFKGLVPQTREELMTLSGVGRKTANVFLNAILGQPTIAVDTHVFRVSRRLGLSAGKNAYEVEKDLEERLPLSYQQHASAWLIHHGRTFCKARRPLCLTCPFQETCPKLI